MGLPPNSFSHISWVLKQSGIRKTAAGLMNITTFHIHCLLRWPRKNLSFYELRTTASLHISWVLRQSGIYAKRFGSMCTALLHISCVLKWSGIAIIRRKVISKGLILLMPLDPGKGQILWTEKMTLCAGHFEVVIHRYKNIIRWSKSDYLMPSINVF